MILYWFVLCLLFLTQRLPLKFCYWTAEILGDLVYVFWPKGRRSVIDNMHHVLGPRATNADVRDTARRSFENYVKLLVDFARAPTTDPATVADKLKGEGWENLDEAFEHGKGVILVGSHLGSWEVAGVALANHGYPINAVSESLRNERINRLAFQFRATSGIELIPMEYALKRVYRALRRNEAVGLVVDRPLPSEQGTPVEFFGQCIAWPTGPAALALRTAAKIVTGYLVRNADNDYLGELYPALEFETTGDNDSDVQRITQQIVRIQEDLIRRFPDQWFMFRPMWPEENKES